LLNVHKKKKKLGQSGIKFLKMKTLEKAPFRGKNVFLRWFVASRWTLLESCVNRDLAIKFVRKWKRLEADILVINLRTCGKSLGRVEKN